MKEPDGSVEDGFVSTATTLIRQFDELLQRQAAEVKQRQETIVEVSFEILKKLKKCEKKWKTKNGKKK